MNLLNLKNSIGFIKLIKLLSLIV